MKFHAKTFAATVIITALMQTAAIAAEPNSALNTHTPQTAPLGAPSPIEGTINPNDGLTTPSERTRLEQERQDRVRNPNAMERQMDRVEEGLGLEGRRQPDVR